MSLTVFRLFAAWRPALSQFMRGFVPIDTEPPAYSFAPTDIAQLHRLTAPDQAAALDDQTWRDLLLDRYADSLSAEVSIFGRQVLYRRMRGGADAGESALRRARVKRLLEDPERLDG